MYVLNSLHTVRVLRYWSLVIFGTKKKEAGKFQFCGCHSNLRINVCSKSICHSIPPVPSTVPGT